MTRQLTAEVAVPSQCYLAEGPVWDPAARLLHWVDINPAARQTSSRADRNRTGNDREHSLRRVVDCGGLRS
jgi:sugar lactone lactonase YvrE